MTELEKLEQELLSRMASNPEVYAQEEDICTIDPNSRTITIPVSRRILGVESDESTERMYFQCPRIVGDNIDLSTLSLRINYLNAKSEKDQYIVTDVKVIGENIIFSWGIRRKVTKYKGNINFIVCAVRASDGVIKNEWNTTLNTDCEVLEGLEVDQTGIQEETKDVVEQLLEIMNTSAEEAVQKVTAEGEKQIEAVQEAAQEVAADREQIGKNKADIAELFRIKAPAIICEAQGKNITVEDSSENYFNGLNVYGKTEQVQTKGYQLLDASKLPTKSQGGATVTNNGGGSFTISGSGNLSENLDFRYDYSHEETIKMLKSGVIALKTEVTTHPYINFGFRNKDGQVLSVSNSYEASSTKDITEWLKDESCFLRLQFFGNSGQPIKTGTIRPMIYQDGDGTWEPFSGGKPSPSPEYPQEIEGIGNSENSYELEVKTTGKNLFNIKDKNKLSGSSKHEIVGESLKIIALDGNTNPVVFCELEHPEKYIGKTIYLKCDEIIKSNANTKPRIVLKYTKNNNLTIKDILNLDTSGKEVSIKLPNDLGLANKVSLAFYVSFNGTYNNGDYAIFNKVMLSREPIEDYQAYKESTSYIPIDSPLYEGDYIYLENGELWEYRENARVVFDGSKDEAWIKENRTEESINRYYIRNNDMKRGNNYTGDMYCDKLKTLVNHNANEEGIAGYNAILSYLPGENWIYILKDGFANTEELKNWLQSNPLEVVYKLATPTRKRLDIESEEAIKTLKTYYPITHVTNSDGAEMKIGYVVDTRLYIDGKFKELQETVVNTQMQMLKGV